MLTPHDSRINAEGLERRTEDLLLKVVALTDNLGTETALYDEAIDLLWVRADRHAAHGNARRAHDILKALADAGHILDKDVPDLEWIEEG